ncbi:unnamed protein product [Meloidogyne enterolobii]|uniref:Uncharacterized protein n=2 Tax=Meloidogyne enterolobii TaxID=390850 RepID=A0ACB1AWQ6_MELEN|nr:unnamed protein product [Meloidogyne enterolobii]
MFNLKNLFFLLCLILIFNFNLILGKQGQPCRVKSDCHDEREVCGIGTNICIPRLGG